MTKYYLATLILTIFSMFIMIISAHYNSLLDKKRKKYSMILFFLIIICSVCEWLGVFLDGTNSNLIPLHYFVKFVELSCAPFVGLVCVLSLKRTKHEKLMLYVFCVHALLEFLSLFIHNIYYIDASNIYHHGPTYFIYYVFYLLSFIYFAIHGFETLKKFQDNNGASIILVIIFIMLSLIIQIIFPDVKIVWHATAIGSLMLYKFYGDMISQTDGLTGLLNRANYEKSITKIKHDVIIIFFDVDKFKNINDDYGHAYGDFCLKEISFLIQKAFSSSGKCFRYGGDEFCVIMHKNLNKIEQLLSLYFLELKQKQDIDSRLPNVSCGYAYYNSKQDNINEIISTADKTMYEYKRKAENCN